MVLDQLAWPYTYDTLNYPEYLTCQDTALNTTFYDALCPFGGHVRNFFGQEYWGKGIPEWGHEPVLQCQAKLGEALLKTAANVSIIGMNYFDSEGIDLGESIDDGPADVPEGFHPSTNRGTFVKWLYNYAKTAMSP